MDPQQRLVLEVAWEALDDAGMAARVGGRQVGVFMGGFMGDSQVLRHLPAARSAINSHTATSGTFTMLSNRLSYVLDLRGPSMTIDTACSSSMVAIHEAAQAVARGECESALAGGVNVMLHPETTISMCKGRLLAPDGRCKSFDAAADGYGRGEGAGVLVLKPVDAARRDGDRIYAVIRGTGTNQDGRTSGITVPNPAAQAALAREVCAAAEVEPHAIGYVEAHGTGTAVGDPLEMSALGQALGAVDGRSEPLVVGSAKSGIGHLEAAAGVAGVMKAALTVYHRTIAPQAWLDTLNPAIPFGELMLRVPTDVEPFPNPSAEPLVAVNGFGYGGSNAHVLMGPAPAAPELPRREPGAKVFPVSGATEEAARSLADKLVPALAGGADLDRISDAAWSRRAHHAFRAGLAYRDADDLVAQLTELRDGGGKNPSRVIVPAGTAPAFVFSGMGPQWWGMARGLLEAEGIFAQTAREIDAAFVEISGWSIIEELLRDEATSRVTRTDVAQPANFLVQACLVAELAALGVRPAAVVGHSVGEVTAAYASGVLSLTDALLVSYHRARVQARTAGTGGMMAVGLAIENASDWIDGDAEVTVAAVNGPSSLTVAGTRKALDELHSRLVARRHLRARAARRGALPQPAHGSDPARARVGARRSPAGPAVAAPLLDRHGRGGHRRVVGRCVLARQRPSARAVRERHRHDDRRGPPGVPRGGAASGGRRQRSRAPGSRRREGHQHPDAGAQAGRSDQPAAGRRRALRRRLPGERQAAGCGGWRDRPRRPPRVSVAEDAPVERERNLGAGTLRDVGRAPAARRADGGACARVGGRAVRRRPALAAGSRRQRTGAAAGGRLPRRGALRGGGADRPRVPGGRVRPLRRAAGDRRARCPGRSVGRGGEHQPIHRAVTNRDGHRVDRARHRPAARRGRRVAPDLDRPRARGGDGLGRRALRTPRRDRVALRPCLPADRRRPRRGRDGGGDRRCELPEGHRARRVSDRDGRGAAMCRRPGHRDRRGRHGAVGGADGSPVRCRAADRHGGGTAPRHRRAPCRRGDLLARGRGHPRARRHRVRADRATAAHPHRARAAVLRDGVGMARSRGRARRHRRRGSRHRRLERAGVPPRARPGEGASTRTPARGRRVGQHGGDGRRRRRRQGVPRRGRSGARHRARGTRRAGRRQSSRLRRRRRSGRGCPWRRAGRRRQRRRARRHRDGERAAAAGRPPRAGARARRADRRAPGAAQRAAAPAVATRRRRARVQRRRAPGRAVAGRRRRRRRRRGLPAAGGAHGPPDQEDVRRPCPAVRGSPTACRSRGGVSSSTCRVPAASASSRCARATASHRATARWSCGWRRSASTTRTP